MPSVAYRLLYWQNGSSDLKEAVTLFTDYLSTGTVPTPAPTTAQIDLIKTYIATWINYDGWKIKKDDETDFATLKTGVLGLSTFAAISTWLKTAIYFGIDPF